jgi:hypothetical protein
MLSESIQTGTFARTAYVDANDPSVIFVEQPQIDPATLPVALPVNAEGKDDGIPVAVVHQ